MVDFNLPLIATIAISLTYLALLVLVFRGARFDRKLEVSLTGFLLTSLVSMVILGIQYTEYSVYFRLDVLYRLHIYGIVLSAAFLTYLTGHVVRSRRKNVLWWVVGAFLLATSGIIYENPFALPEQIIRTSTYYIPRVNAGLALAIASWGVFTTFSFFLLIQGYRRTNRPLHRNRYKYWSIAWGLFAVGSGLWLFQPLFGSLLLISSAVFIVYTSSTLHLPDLRLFARKSASFILSGILAAVVYGGLIGWLFTQRSAFSDFNLTVAIVGLGAAFALLVNPLLNLVQQFIFRVVSGTRRDASGLLNEYSKNISNILDLERLSETVKSLLVEAFAVETTALFLVDYSEDLTSFLLRNASESDSEKGSSASGILAGKSPVALAMSRERLPLTQYDIDLAPRYLSTASSERSWLSALGMDVFIPIFVQDRWIGLLTLGPKSSGDRYFKQELEILQSIADQTAVALENAKLYENIVQRNLENERLNQDLSSANEKLAQLDQAKSDFISIASHELRTPLTQIIGYNDIIGDMVQSGSVPHSVGIQMVDSVRKAARRLEEIVDTMFDVSRLDTKTLELAKSPTSIPLIVAGAVDKWSKALDERKLSISVKGLNKLPSIQADGKRLTQVFSNLIQNAIKSTPDGGQIRITGRQIVNDDSAASSPSFVEILVADTGIGISSDDLERIFEKFYRVGNVLLHSTGDTKFKGAGPGLGLTIARGIIEAHGGRIWADSTGYDENTLPGATLHVLLPVNGADTSDHASASGQNAPQ